MRFRLRPLPAALGFALLGAGVAAPAHAVDFLGIPLWESYPGQYSRPGYYYHPPTTYFERPSTYYYYEPQSGRYLPYRYY